MCCSDLMAQQYCLRQHWGFLSNLGILYYKLRHEKSVQVLNLTVNNKFLLSPVMFSSSNLETLTYMLLLLLAMIIWILTSLALIKLLLLIATDTKCHHLIFLNETGVHEHILSRFLFSSQVSCLFLNLFKIPLLSLSLRLHLICLNCCTSLQKLCSPQTGWPDFDGSIEKAGCKIRSDIDFCIVAFQVLQFFTFILHAGSFSYFLKIWSRKNTLTPRPSIQWCWHSPPLFLHLFLYWFGGDWR